jgi:hypothetical protein
LRKKITIAAGGNQKVQQFASRKGLGVNRVSRKKQENSHKNRVAFVFGIDYKFRQTDSLSRASKKWCAFIEPKARGGKMPT